MDDPYSYCSFIISIGLTFKPFSLGVGIAIFSMLSLLVLSALISAAEAAFFSLSPNDKESLAKSSNAKDQRVLELLQKPKRLLATLLISLNFVNIAIVITSTFITDALINADSCPAWLLFTIQVVIVTFLILLTAEIIPKVYATQHALSTSRMMSLPVIFMKKTFYPISSFLIFSTSAIDKRVRQRGHNISVDELSHALELTDDDELEKDDQKILEGIVNFGNTDVKQIMKSRMDVDAVEYEISFEQLLQEIFNSGYSRIPVYKESFDNIEGVLYIKDLLPHLDKKEFKWQALIRPPFFVPENKKLDDLLKEFQQSKIHMAIVVDEYGGTSGIITLEDVIEEIVGEINDEFDNDDLVYSKLDDHNFVFEGKVPLKDLYRILDIDGDDFESAKGEADSLAGFLIELEGRIPKKNEVMKFKKFTFLIESADNRKVKRIKVSIEEAQEMNQKKVSNEK